MSPSRTRKPETAGGDVLARAFLAILSHIERNKRERRDGELDLSDSEDPVERLVASTEGALKPEFVPIRADLAAVAIQVARAIEAEPGLVARLRREAPIVTLAIHVGDLTELVAEVFRLCVFQKGTLIQELTRDSASSTRVNRAVVVSRDGTNKYHTEEVGNDLIGRVLYARVPVIGIAPDPIRELPRDLNRAAENRLALPPFDGIALSLVIESVVGAAPTTRLDDALVRTLDISDLPVALRAAREPDEALDAIARVVSAKADYLHDGRALEDLHGYGEAKAWGLALAQDLLMYRSGALDWKSVDSRALLLTGPPGVGKTSYARAVAKQCKVPLVATSVAEWNAAEYLSGTLKRIREVFANAKSRAPCILFIDELDGISDRAKLRGEYVQYWSQVVNCFLELLSGIETFDGVVVIAATNYPELVDAAVKRAGRLDREIEIPLPDSSTLCAIFRQYVGDDLPPDADLMALALAARGRTGADVESWVRRARGSARRSGRGIGVDDVLAEIRAGRPPLPPDVRRRIAIHEAGHVVVAHAAFGGGTIIDISLHDLGGEVYYENRLAGDATLERVEAALAVGLAGRAAETLAFGSPSIGAGNGAASDLGRATILARDLELRFGMGRLGLVQIDHYPGDLFLVRGLLDAVSARLRHAERRAHDVLQKRWVGVEAIAGALEHRGYLAGPEISAILDEHPSDADLPSGSSSEDQEAPGRNFTGAQS